MTGATTIISNPSEPTMAARTLEKTTRSGSTRTKTTTPAKTSEATLVLANGGDDSEALRVGLALVAAGVTGVAIGVLEGLSRRGKVKWYGKLTSGKKATLMLAVFFAAGMTARWRRREGDFKGACAAEAMAISAFTIAAVILAESAADGDAGEVKGLGLLADGADAALANLDGRQLDQLDNLLDDDIRRAARELRKMHARGQLQVREGEDVAGLESYGDLEDDDHDEDEDELAF